jgi:hypothetical protein
MACAARSGSFVDDCCGLAHPAVNGRRARREGDSPRFAPPIQAHSFRKGGRLVDPPGRRMVGAKRENPILSSIALCPPNEDELSRGIRYAAGSVLLAVAPSSSQSSAS